MKNYLLLTNLLICLTAISQTPLEKGDVMVLGVNSNNSCGLANQVDIIFLVFLKDVQTNTTFYLTDNGWAGSNFNTNEGIIKVQRTGGLLPAGSISKIIIDDVGGGTSPGWTLQRQTSANPFNLNTNADQFFIWQGTWNSSGNMTGNFLVSFNTKRTWTSTGAAAENSIFPSTQTCFHQSFHLNENRRYRYYNGPTNSISHGEWFVRILNKDRWKNDITNDMSGCDLFNSNFTLTNIPIQTSIPSQEICKGESLTTLEVVDETNVVLYQWYSNTTPSNTGGSLIPGANNHTYTPPNTAIGTTYYYCVMTIDLPLNGVSNTTDCTFVSNVFKVTVNPNPITSPVTPL